MIMNIIRIIFVASFIGAGMTGAPVFAAVAIIPGIILLVTDGKELMIVYVIVGLLLMGAAISLFG